MSNSIVSTKAQGFIFRKIIHVFLNAGIALLLLSVQPQIVPPIVLFLFVSTSIIEFLRLKTSYRKQLNKTMDPVLKKKERKRLSSVFWGMLASLIVAPFVSTIALSYAFAVFALADPFAAIVGKYSESRKLYKNKTLHGTTTFAVVAAFVSVTYAFVLSLPLPSIVLLLFASGFLAAVEMLSDPLDDNFTLIVVGAFLAHLIF